MTWLFPGIARLLTFRALPLASRQLIPSGLPAAATDPMEIAVLIPAHNDEKNLERTLNSVARAIRAAEQAASPGQALKFRVQVGADGCQDATVAVAHRHGAGVLESSANIGKWRILARLVDRVPEARWVVLADAGIQWPEEFLVRLSPLFSRPELMAIAPTYRAPDAGRLESLLWGAERHFKTLESALGGPVTVHGATVLYRRAELQQALRTLGDTAWLNDDVVVPLTLRALFPDQQIRYEPGLAVYDELRTPQVAAPDARREFARRRRLVCGNIQWIRQILPALWGRNRLVFVLALRRVFRMLWAWWSFSLAAGLAGLGIQLARSPRFIRDFRALASASPERSFVHFSPGLGGAALALALTLAGMVLLGHRGRTRLRPVAALGGFSDSARASLLAPWYFFTDPNAERIRWK